MLLDLLPLLVTPATPTPTSPVLGGPVWSPRPNQPTRVHRDDDETVLAVLGAL